MSAPFPLPKQPSGLYVLVAQVTAKAGKAEEVERILKICKADADANEPNTHTYRTLRGSATDGDSNNFTIIEEYSVPGLHEHVKGQVFQDLIAADLFSDVKTAYYNEFQ